MKTLYLVRHAKASLDNPLERDLDRPLIESGIKRTRQVIEYLHKKQASVDLILSSPAVRAFETASYIAHALHYPTENIKIERTIYTGDTDKIADLFYDLSKKIGSLMIVGHNPSITNFANLLLPEPIDYLPTSGLVCLQFEAKTWDEIWQAKIITNFVVSSRMIKDDKGE